MFQHCIFIGEQFLTTSRVPTAFHNCDALQITAREWNQGATKSATIISLLFNSLRQGFNLSHPQLSALLTLKSCFYSASHGAQSSQPPQRSLVEDGPCLSQPPACHQTIVRPSCGSIWLAHRTHCLKSCSPLLRCKQNAHPAQIARSFNQKARQGPGLGMLSNNCSRSSSPALCWQTEHVLSKKASAPDVALNPKSKQFCNCWEESSCIRGLQTQREVRTHSGGFGNYQPNAALFIILKSKQGCRQSAAQEHHAAEKSCTTKMPHRSTNHCTRW